MNRHINLEAMFTSDPAKSKEENEIAKREHYKKYGIDINDITPEEEKAILEELKKHTNKVYRHGEFLHEKYLADICAIFIIQINKEADAANKREHYRDVCTSIKKFSKSGYKTEALGLVQELKEKYKRKPAFVDELTKI